MPEKTPRIKMSETNVQKTKDEPSQRISTYVLFFWNDVEPV